MAEQGGHELVEGEDRGGREPRQDGDRLAPTAPRQIGLPGLSATPWTRRPAPDGRGRGTRRRQPPARAAAEQDEVAGEARSMADSSPASSSPTIPSWTGSAPSSRTASVIIVALAS